MGDMAFLELTAVMEDKNRNNTYEGNEFVWEKGEKMQIPVLNPPFL
jgi:hypothetical protein